MKIVWLGHACFKVITEDGSIVFDPYSDGSVKGCGPVRETADCVLCSHGHGDHNFKDGVTLSGKPFGGKIETVDTFHDPFKGEKRGKNIIHIVYSEGMKVVHMGDTGCELEEEQKKQLMDTDVLMIPVGGFFTIDAQAAYKLVSEISPKIVIPMHYHDDEHGLAPIGTVDEYTKLTDNTVTYPVNELTVTKDTASQTAVLSWPK